MEQPVKLPAEVNFGGYRCECHRTSYAAGGGTALYLTDIEDGEPVATATINVSGVSEAIPEQLVVIKDYSEGEGMLDALVEAGIVEDTGERVTTGYVEAPIARLL